MFYLLACMGLGLKVVHNQLYILNMLEKKLEKNLTFWICWTFWRSRRRWRPKKDELQAEYQSQVKKEPNIQDTKPRARSHTVGEPRAKVLRIQSQEPNYDTERSPMIDGNKSKYNPEPGTRSRLLIQRTKMCRVIQRSINAKGQRFRWANDPNDPASGLDD